MFGFFKKTPESYARKLVDLIHLRAYPGIFTSDEAVDAKIKSIAAKCPEAAGTYVKDWSYPVINAVAMSLPLDVLEALVTSENVKIEGSDGKTALTKLFDAYSHGERFDEKGEFKKKFDLLLEKGADVAHVDKFNRSTLDLALESSGHINFPKAVEKLIDNGARVDFVDEKFKEHEVKKNTSGYQDTPLMKLAQHGHDRLGELASKIIRKGALVNRERNDGTTALHYAAANDSNDVAKVLIDAKADLDKKDESGKTPLFYAVGNSSIHGSLKVMEMLLTAGADKNAQDKDGNTALHCLVNEITQYNRPYILQKVESLLNAGADVNIPNNKGKTSMDRARESNDLELTEILSGKKVAEQTTFRDAEAARAAARSTEGVAVTV